MPVEGCMLGVGLCERSNQDMITEAGTIQCLFDSGERRMYQSRQSMRA